MKSNLFKILLLFLTINLYSLDWYKSQEGTGIGNCGPACVSMAVLWSTGWDIPVSYIRNYIIGYTNWDGSTDIYQLYYAISQYTICALFEINDLKNLTFNENIYIILIDTKYISNKLYDYEGGHYIILYEKIGNYFLVNDPLKNSKNVAYKINEIKEALKNNLLLIIPKRK